MSQWKPNPFARAQPTRLIAEDELRAEVSNPEPARIARKHLNTEEAAIYLGLSPRSLERYRVDGTGPTFMKAGPGKRARVFYRREDLDTWLEGSLFTSTSEYAE